MSCSKLFSIPSLSLKDLFRSISTSTPENRELNSCLASVESLCGGQRQMINAKHTERMFSLKESFISIKDKLLPVQGPVRVQ